MTGLNVRTTLRYRPGPDVLSGEIDLRAAGGEATSTESPDADSTFVWVAAHTNEVRSQVEYLSSFQLVHASARLADHTAVTPLPAVIERAARELIATSLEALTFHNSTAARLRAKAESSAELPLESVQRADSTTRPRVHSVVDSSAAPRLSTSLTRISEAVRRRVSTDDEAATATDHLSQLLLELSSTVSFRRGRAAPSTTAATRAAARGRAALTECERQALERAFRDLDDPASWHQVSESLDQLTLLIERSERA